MSELGPVGGAGELTPEKLVESWESAASYCSDRGYKTALQSCASALRQSLAAKAPQGVPAGQSAKADAFLHTPAITSGAELREKIAVALWETRSPEALRDWDNEKSWIKDYHYKQADAVLAALAAPSAPSLPVPGPVSDATIHHGMFPPSWPADPRVQCMKCGEIFIEDARPCPKCGSKNIHYKVYREAAAPKPAPAFKAVRLEDGGAMGTHVVVPDATEERAVATARGDFSTWLTPAPGAERLRETLTQIAHIAGAPEGALPSLWADTRRERLDRIAAIAREALAAAPPAVEPVLVGKMRQFAEECLRRHAINPKYSNEIMHTKDTYHDLLKLCDMAEGHASAERVRELIAKIQKWRDEGWMKETTSETIIRKRAYDRVLGAVLALLPPSTGEKS